MAMLEGRRLAYDPDMVQVCGPGPDGNGLCGEASIAEGHDGPPIWLQNPAINWANVWTELCRTELCRTEILTLTVYGD